MDVSWAIIGIIIGTSIIIVGFAALIVYLSIILPFRILKWLVKAARNRSEAH